MLNIEQLKVKIKGCTNKIKTSNFKLEEYEGFASLFSNVEQIMEEIYGYFMSMTSIDDAMKSLPETGQLLSELSQVPMIQLCPELFTAWIKCVLWFYKTDASSSIEVKARDWALKLLHSTVSCQMKTDDPALRTLGMTSSVLLRNQLSHNIHKIIKLLDVGNGRQWESSSDCYTPSKYQKIGVLKGISNVLLTVLHEDEFCSVWPAVLQHLSQCPPDDDVLNIYHKLAASQQGAYTGECKVKLSYNTLIILWSSHLPALEQEILQMVNAASLCLGLPSLIKKIIQSRNLAMACSENHQVLHAVHQMLFSLLAQTGGNGRMAEIITQFFESVRKSREQTHAMYEVYVPSVNPVLQPLVSLLSHPANHLGSEKMSHHLQQISNVLKSTSLSPELTTSLSILTLEFKHWTHNALWHLIQCDKKTVESCLDVIYLSSFHNPDIEVDKSSTREIVHCLRGLVGKTNLKLPDIEYTICSSIKPSGDNCIIRQILVVFLLQSVSGIHLARDILKLATCSTDSDHHLSVLLYAHQVFDVDMTTWSPYKISKYRQLLTTFKEQLSSDSVLKGESGIKSVQNHEEMMKELESVLCTPALSQ